MEYCTVCGKEKVEEWTGCYIKETGKKRMRLICPDKPCEHTGHMNPNLITKSGIERYKNSLRWIYRMRSPDYECERCGGFSWLPDY